MSFFEKLFGSFSDKELKRINPLKDKVLALEPEMAKLTTCCRRRSPSAARPTGACWA